MAEWQNGNRMAEWQNGVMAEWQNGGWNGGMVEWQNGGMAEWRNGGWNGGMAEWRPNGGMVEQRNGAEWQNDRMVEKVYGMVLTMSQIDNILYNKHGRTEQISCCETCCYLKDVSHKSHDPIQECQSLQFLSKEEGRLKEKIPQHYSFGG